MTTLTEHRGINDYRAKDSPMRIQSPTWLLPNPQTKKGPYMCPWTLALTILSTLVAAGMASPTVAAGMAEWSVTEWAAFFGIAGVALASFAAGALKFVSQIRAMFAAQDKKLDEIKRTAEASIPIQQAEAIATRAAQNATDTPPKIQT